MQEKDNSEFLQEAKKRMERTLSDLELEQVVGGYDETKYNKDSCPNPGVFVFDNCMSCAKCYEQQYDIMLEGRKCHVVDNFCMRKHGQILRSHVSDIATGFTEKITIW